MPGRPSTSSSRSGRRCPGGRSGRGASAWSSSLELASTTSTLKRPPTKGCGSPKCRASTPCPSPSTPFAAVYTADHLLDCVADADSVIIAAGYQAGQPPLVDDPVLRAMRPGAWLVNIARGALLDTEAALAHLNTGHLAGIGLDVFPSEPYPADGPLLAHPHVVATAHTAPLTSDYFAAS